jgi:hypothetical protein
MERNGHQKMQPHRASVRAVADSGAQSNLWSLQFYTDAGFAQNDLLQVQNNLNAANKTPIQIVGAFFAHLQGQMPDGSKISVRSMIYVSPDVSDLYLSQETMMYLKIINQDFQKIGSARSPVKNINDTWSITSVNVIRAINAGCSATEKNGATCSCPQRSIVPDCPTSLPFACAPENNGKIKQWLLDIYAPSTFNTCPH